MKEMNKVFYGKIILFGEYAIIFDSMALTIPFSHFHGELSYDNTYNRYKYTDYDFAKSSNTQIDSYSTHLKKLMEEGKLNADFDFNRLTRDLNNGLYFESTIPQGFGLGSSGALVAALYSRYAKNKIEGGRSVSKNDTLILRQIFSTMESYFHGKSSGIDPLNSYIQYPLLIRSKTDIEKVEIPRKKFDSQSAIFLINTGMPGKTEPLVNLFIEKCNNPDFFHVIANEYIPLSNKCIQDLVSGHMNSFFTGLTSLSNLQYQHFREMIPAQYLPVWKEGLDSSRFNLKLCGSGGGGYLLGFTQNFPETQAWLQKEGMEMITVYKSGK
jgi:mevalonate kinase